MAGARYMTWFNTAFQMGTAARSPVADADDCIMVGAAYANRIQGRSAPWTLRKPAPPLTALGFRPEIPHSSTVLGAVKDASRCCAVPYGPP